MTLYIILLTVVVSIVAFQRPDLMNKLQFNPYMTFHRKEWYRLLTHGFVHANWWHLGINMLVLFSFGIKVERYLDELFFRGYIGSTVFTYMIIYIGGVVISSLLTLYKHKDNGYYNSVGASGAVSAIFMMAVFYKPWDEVYFFGIQQLGIPAVIAGVLLIIVSIVMGKKGVDNINHDAHLLGAVFGFIFSLFIAPSLFLTFIDRLMAF